MSILLWWMATNLIKKYFIQDTLIIVPLFSFQKCSLVHSSHTYKKDAISKFY